MKKDDELHSLALEIADETARSDVEVCCGEYQLSGQRWYDATSAPPEDVEWVERALRYLDLRGLLIRHPQHPHLVRWEIGRAVEQKQ